MLFVVLREIDNEYIILNSPFVRLIDTYIFKSFIYIRLFTYITSHCQTHSFILVRQFFFYTMRFIVCRILRTQFFLFAWLEYRIRDTFLCQNEMKNFQLINIGCDDVCYVSSKKSWKQEVKKSKIIWHLVYDKTHFKWRIKMGVCYISKVKDKLL